MDERCEALVYPVENPELVGLTADASAPDLAVPGFDAFIHARTSPPLPPKHPITASCGGSDKLKRQTFDIYNQETKKKYYSLISTHEKEKANYDLLNLYSPDLAGYGTYLSKHHPQVLAFFGQQRPFRLQKKSRCLHTYLVGGAGSGKSEYLKSDVWYYLTENTSTAVVFIDPHNDVSEQIAKFKPNRDNDRLVYVKPGINGQDFPGLNPFDIDGKETLSDKDAEDYTDEFISAFKEILEGNLTDQMETILRNTIPILVKMPDTSVYDLIDFLRPKAKEIKPAKGDTDIPAPKEYLAQQYLDFAKANFENEVMLKFLETQFDDDSGYAITRNALTTRLLGIFGSTLMQGLFKGKRTVRLEELIPQRKLVVFNLADLKNGTQVIGRFLLITLKIFALNQAKIPEHARTVCHVYVDECQKFITDSMTDILNEARKFFVFLTLAQQSAGGGMEAEMFASVLTNTATKIVGSAGGPSLALMAKEVGVPAETIGGFKAGQFVVFQREASPQQAIVRMPTNTLHNRAGMSAGDWKLLLETQMNRYYRRGGNRALRQDVARTGTAPVVATALFVVNAPLTTNIDDLLT